MKKKDKFLNLFGTILVIIMVIPVIIYLRKFWDIELSPDHQVWGTFGDYLGGLLNPILAFANLVIFIRLTFVVANMNDKSSQNALNHEKLVLMSGLMHDVTKELSSALNGLGQGMLISQKNAKWEIIKLKQIIITFSENNTYLFSMPDTAPIISSLDKMLNASGTSNLKEDFINAFSDYLNLKDKLIQQLNIQTISKLEAHDK